MKIRIRPLVVATSLGLAISGTLTIASPALATEPRAERDRDH
jgi:hypothetical protein